MFETKAAAKSLIRQEPQLGLKRVYRCPISDTYHVTTKTENDNRVTTLRRRFDIKTVEKELKEEARKLMAVEDQTLTKNIVKHLEELYRQDKTYKISSKMMFEKFSHQARTTVAAQLSAMKKAKILTSLDESVPDQRGAVYFALTSILDEVTKPKKEEVPVDMAKVSVPTQPEKKPIPVNPFEDVKKQLADINTRLNGLAQGYADLANKPAPTVDFTDVLRSLDNKPNSTVIAKYLGNFEESVLTRLNKLDQRLTQQPATVDTKKLVSELTDLTDEESLVYLLRDGSITNEMLVGIHDSLLKAIENPSRNTGDSSEDYKRGLADGIKLCIQMGLKLDGN